MRVTSVGAKLARDSGMPVTGKLSDPLSSRASSLPQKLSHRVYCRHKKSGAQCAAFCCPKVSGGCCVHRDRHVHDRGRRVPNDHVRLDRLGRHSSRPGHGRPSHPDSDKTGTPLAVASSSVGLVDSNAVPSNSAAPVGNTAVRNSHAEPNNNSRHRNRPAPVRCRHRNGSSSSLRRNKARMPKESNRETQ